MTVRERTEPTDEKKMLVDSFVSLYPFSYMSTTMYVQNCCACDLWRFFPCRNIIIIIICSFFFSLAFANDFYGVRAHSSSRLISTVSASHLTSTAVVQTFQKQPHDPTEPSQNQTIVIFDGNFVRCARGPLYIAAEVIQYINESCDVAHCRAHRHIGSGMTATAERTMRTMWQPCKHWGN